MPESQYSARLSIALAGDVATAINTHDNPDIEDASWIAVRIGPVLTQCSTTTAILGRVAVWTDAASKGVRILPAQQPAIDHCDLIAQVDAKPDDLWDVIGWAATATPDGIPVLSVRTGPLTIRCYDQLVITSILEAWTDAAQIARIMWRLTRRPRLKPVKKT